MTHMNYAIFVYFLSLTTVCLFAIDTINTDTRYYKPGPYQQINLVPSIRRRFSTFPKYLKLDYKHIFGIELGFSRRGVLFVEGFHHDTMNLLEKSGVIEFADKIVYENDFYQATLRYNSNVVKQTATFFPSHWSREQVMNKIYEAYGNFVKSGSKPILTRDGKYVIKGTIEEGIEIEMRITKNGHICTAYPIL
jgi:hypothetical protein